MASAGELRLPRGGRAPTGGREAAIGTLTVLAAAVLLLAAGRVLGDAGIAAVALAGGVALALLALGDPTRALILMLVAGFLAIPLSTAGVPVELYQLAFLGVLAATGLAIISRSSKPMPAGIVEVLFFLFLAWNVGSALVPHQYDVVLSTAEEFSLRRFLVGSIVIPGVLFYIGRTVFDRESAVRRLLWALVGLAAVSVFLSIAQFHAPGLVWPRYIVDAPAWEDRAVGIFNQPVANGLLIITGLVAALALVAQPSTRGLARGAALLLAATAPYAVFLTQTRVIWLVFVLVLLGGCIVARGMRTGFVIIMVAVLAFGSQAINLTGSDRASGGVASENEVHDRLNGIATAVAAVREKPLAGWGVGRFGQVNTHRHKQWSPTVPWERGYGIASHQNELGIAAELGLVGLALWLSIVGTILVKLWRAAMVLPWRGLMGRGLLVTGSFTFMGWVLSGLTVDLRFLDFPNAAALLLAGVVIGHAERLRGAERRRAAESRGRRPVPARTPVRHPVSG